MKKFSVYQDNNILIIRHRFISRLLEFSGKLLPFLASFMVFLFPYDQLIALNQYLFIIYFLPVLPLLKIIPSLGYLMKGSKFEFNRKTDQVFHNDRYKEKVTNIQIVEWNIKQVSESIEYYLEIRTVDNNKYRITTTNFGLNIEHLELGRQIARFLKIMFINNDPRKKEILWGNCDVDESSIRHIDNTVL